MCPGNLYMMNLDGIRVSALTIRNQRPKVSIVKPKIPPLIYSSIWRNTFLGIMEVVSSGAVLEVASIAGSIGP